MPQINAARLLQDLDTLRDFGRCGSGVVRPSLSSIDLQARRWLAEQMRAAGLDAELDGLGNVIGRSPKPGPALLLGSHSDTQPRGGWLDGALGVIYALEVVRACAEDTDPRVRDAAIDAVAWVDEEGTYLSCLGSRGFCDLLDPREIDSAQNLAGDKLQQALREAGLNGQAARPEPGRYRGYLEAHIEQGPHLENAGLSIGVVTDIVGSRNYQLRFHGEQNHAGSTPMPRRRDAGMALIKLAHTIDQRFQQLAGPRTVWTIGKVDFDPGTSSIIPGKAEMLLQFRDPQVARLQAFSDALDELIATANHSGPVKVDCIASAPPMTPAVMDVDLAEALARAAAIHAPDGWQKMPSAAIHDATYVSRIMPAAMLFIPSIGGISHDFAEDTAADDIVRGCQVLASAAADLLSGPNGARQ